MKKGYTLIEIIISIAILGSIMAAVGTLFVVAVKNYRTETQKSLFQRELNFVVDNIIKDVKGASIAPTEYDGFELSPSTLILGMPATDSGGDFIYTGENLELDYFVYYLSGSDLKKKVYPNIQSVREQSDNVILANVSSHTFSYYPGVGDASQITVSLTVSADVGKVVSLTEERVTNLRNKQ
jgi:prepilin-type N-terminal cleavage/methylation domain-containing protein